MRKLIVFVLLLVAALAGAQTVLYRDQATLQWDAVTTDAQGNPLLPTDVISYEVYIYDYTIGVADPQNVVLLTFVAVMPTLEQLIVFPYRTVWAAGVRTRLVDAGANVSYSALAWSYIPADADMIAGPFTYVPSGTPVRPGDLRDSGI